MYWSNSCAVCTTVWIKNSLQPPGAPVGTHLCRSLQPSHAWSKCEPIANDRHQRNWDGPCLTYHDVAPPIKVSINVHLREGGPLAAGARGLHGY